MAGVGHNSGFAKDQLLGFVQRIERLNEEKAATGEDIKEVFKEAKGTGFDTPTMRRLLKTRKKDKAKRQEEAALDELYQTATGDMLD